MNSDRHGEISSIASFCKLDEVKHSSNQGNRNQPRYRK